MFARLLSYSVKSHHTFGSASATQESDCFIKTMTNHGTTMAHKGHAANKKRSLQTKNDRCKQKRCAANKKRSLQTKKMRCKQKNDRCKQKRCAANKKRSLQRKKMRCKQKTIATNKKRWLQTKKDALQTKNAVAIWPVTGQGFQNTKWPAVRYFQ